jgi:hypothetical protein
MEFFFYLMTDKENSAPTFLYQLSYTILLLMWVKLLLFATVAYFTILKMEAVYSSEVSISFYQTIRRHITKDSSLPCTVTVILTEFVQDELSLVCICSDAQT